MGATGQPRSIRKARTALSGDARVETKETPGDLWIVEAAGPDTALALAQKAAMACPEGDRWPSAPRRAPAGFGATPGSARASPRRDPALRESAALLVDVGVPVDPLGSSERPGGSV
jgi:hypothetical protein